MTSRRRLLRLVNRTDRKLDTARSPHEVVAVFERFTHDLVTFRDRREDRRKRRGLPSWP